MRNLTSISGLAAVAALALPLAATAVDPTDTVTPALSMVEDNDIKTSAAGVAYITGGVGDAEQATMAARFNDFALKLVNVKSGPEGAFVSNVDVTVTNADGETVVETTASGPWLFVDLPAGTYEVTASFDGQTQANTIVLQQDANQRMVMDWNPDSSVAKQVDWQ